jgi:non-specific serine/threonine protein kinase
MIGQRICHYRIDAELGRGGMGVVYRAHDERLQRKVALKILLGEIANQAERRARVLSEARAAAALNHPGVITIYEVGEEGDQAFIVMELLTGRSLQARLGAEGRMEPRTLALLGAQVAEALAAAHAKGVLHGDIKPANIVVSPDERVKLLDFGIARRTASETLSLTHTGAASSWLPESQTAGTLAYMAPEQWRGEAMDARSDLFSFGVVLYEMAAGSRPFPGPTAAALADQVLNQSPVPLGSVVPGTPPELGRIVHKLLEKRPDSRYQSAREVQVDLVNLIRDLELGPSLNAAVVGKRSVAVLPFKLLTPSAEDEYLSVALADAVINHLSSSNELLVRPTSTVQKYARQAIDTLLAARELNVQVVIDGSIQKLGPKLRVHVQARSVADGVVLLSEKYDSEMADLFGLQDRMAERLAMALGVTPEAAPKATVVPPTKNAMAYELFLRGMDRLSRVNRWDARTAIEMFENAVKLDPRFADAWARLAQACFLMAGTYEPGPKWVREADRAIRRALALDRRNADAQCARGQVLWTPSKGFKNRAALQALRGALNLNPGCHQALVWKCLIFLHVGLLEEAAEGLATALATHPDDGFAITFLGQCLIFQGRYEEAQTYLDRALLADPGNLWANLFYPHTALYTNDLARAEERIRVASGVVPGDPLLTSWEGLLWAKRGEWNKAERCVARALRVGKSVLHTHHMVHTAAAIYATMNKPARAIELLSKAASTGLPNYPLFRDDPHFQPIHQNPRFVQLLAKIKREGDAYRREFCKP